MVWASLSMDKTFHFLVSYETATDVSPENAQALLMFHMTSGCDRASCFAGRGKRTAWTVWKAFPQLTQTLTDLSTAPTLINEDAIKIIEKFVILLNDKASTATDINKVHQKKFAKNNAEWISQTRAALEQLVRQVTFQGRHARGQGLVGIPALPPPDELDWMKTTNGLYEPH